MALYLRASRRAPALYLSYRVRQVPLLCCAQVQVFYNNAAGVPLLLSETKG